LTWPSGDAIVEWKAKVFLVKGRRTMKIERVKTQGEGRLLDSFEKGDCVRLVSERIGDSGPFIGHVYIVGAVGGRRLAINLSDGSHRGEGVFVLEPNAKVVIG
jgi:hypothetical protein